MPSHFAYDLSLDVHAIGGNGHAKSMGAYEAHFITATWRALLDEYRRLGCDPGLYLTPPAEVPAA